MLFYGAGCILGSILPNCFQICTALRFILFFWIGFKIRQHGSDIVMRIPVPLYLFADITTYIIVLTTPTSNYFLKLISAILKCILYSIGSVMAFVLLQKFSNSISWKTNIIVSFLSKRTMPIYLLHQQIIYISIFLLNGKIHPVLHFGINFFTAVGFSAVISSVLLLTRPTRFLIGEKIEN